MPILYVVMPVFNEGSTLGEIVHRVLSAPMPTGWSVQLIMVDDGSRADAAQATVQCAARAGGAVHLIVHPHNRGKGAALMTGCSAVLTRATDSDAMLVQDADLEYDPADFRALLAALGNPSIGAVFGNRWGTGTERSGYRHLHALANRALTWLSNQATGLGVHDMECCYKLLRIPVLRTVLPWLSEERFGIEPQIAAALARAQIRVAEVPVQYSPRTFAEGKKIRWTDGVRALWVIVRERLRSRAPHAVGNHQ
jgi:glycosyltransferase involved in cell wall biosynthesis